MRTKVKAIFVISVFSGLKNVTSKVYTNNKKDTHLLVCVFFAVEKDRFEDLNATVRWTVAADGLTEADL